jgi:hypothetical protein
MKSRSRGVVLGVALLALLGCMFPIGAAADSHQSVAVTFNLCPGSGPSACAGVKIYIDSASNHYRPSDRYSYCTKDETSTGFTPTYNGEVRHVSMTAKGGVATSCQSPVASRNTWIVQAVRNDKVISHGAIWLGQNTGYGTGFYAACGKDAPLNPAFGNMTCEVNGRFGLTLSVPGSKPTYKDCPDTSDGYCAIALHVDSTKPCLSLPISSFTSSFGFCLGKSDGTQNWTTPLEALDKLFFAGFGWANYQNQRWAAYMMSQGLTQVGIVAGTVPSASSDQFHVRYAGLWPLDPDRSGYLTSGTGGAPGAPGGPLLFDFKSGRIGADVYLRGFLRRERGPAPAEVEGIPDLIHGLPEIAEGPAAEVPPELRPLFEDIAGPS